MKAPLKYEMDRKAEGGFWQAKPANISICGRPVEQWAGSFVRIAVAQKPPKFGN